MKTTIATTTKRRERKRDRGKEGKRDRGKEEKWESGKKIWYGAGREKSRSINFIVYQTATTSSIPYRSLKLFNHRLIQRNCILNLKITSPRIHFFLFTRWTGIFAIVCSKLKC